MIEAELGAEELIRVWQGVAVATGILADREAEVASHLIGAHERRQGYTKAVPTIPHTGKLAELTY